MVAMFQRLRLRCTQREIPNFWSVGGTRGTLLTLHDDVAMIDFVFNQAGQLVDVMVVER